jgi:hypothetical protein
MGITVQHDIPAGLAVQAGTLGGAGQLASEYRKRMETFQLQANSINSQKQMQQASLKAQADRQAEQISAQKEQMLTGHALSINTMAQDLAKQQILNEQMHKFGLEDMQAKQDMFEENYTWKQQQEKENIQNVRNSVMNDPSYGEPGTMTTQRQQAIWDLDRADANITPSMRPKQVPIKIEDELENRFMPQPDGSVFFMQPDGDIEYRPPAQDKQAESARKQAEAEIKAKAEMQKLEAKAKADQAKIAQDIMKNAIADPAMMNTPLYQQAKRFMDNYFMATDGAPQQNQSLWDRIKAGLIEVGKRQLGFSVGPAAPGAPQPAPGTNQLAPGVSPSAQPGALDTSDYAKIISTMTPMDSSAQPRAFDNTIPPQGQGPAPESYPEIASKKDYDRLPAGFLYRKNGKLYRKK